MASNPKILTRIIIEGHASNREFAQETIMIGRGANNDLVIQAQGVSGVHALLKLNGHTLTIQDLGSTNGTYVNGVRINNTTPVSAKDIISIGRAEMRVKIKAEKAVQHVAAPAPLEEESTPVEEAPKAPSMAALEDEDTPTEAEELQNPVQLSAAHVAGGQLREAAPVHEAAPLHVALQTRDAAPLRNVAPAHNTPRAEVIKPAQAFTAPVAAKSASQAPDEAPRPDNKVLEISMLWGEQLMAVSHHTKPESIYIGDDKKNEFRIETKELIGSDRFPFVVAENGGHILQFTDQMNLLITDGLGQVLGDKNTLLRAGKVAHVPYPGTKGIYRYPLALSDRISLQVGEITFIIRYVAPARWLPINVANTLDFYFSKVVAISLIAHIFLVLALLFTPQMPAGLETKLFQDPDRFANLIIAPPPVKKAKDDFKLQAKIEKVQQQTTKTTEREKFGKVEEKKVLASGKKGPAVDLDKRERDQKRALSSGIFSALKGSKGAASVFSGGGLGAGINNAVATLQGPSVEDAGGAGGLGSRGTGGAYGSGGLGIGGLGSGSGGGGLGGGGGNVGLAGRGKSTYSVSAGRSVVEGGLSKAEVAKVLQRAESQIRYCYEKELQNKPNLYGKIVATFKIGPNGRVIQSSISQTTMNDSNVESCVLQVINRLVFPNPRGGGAVDVNYPWLFKRSD